MVKMHKIRLVIKGLLCMFVGWLLFCGKIWMAITPKNQEVVLTVVGRYNIMRLRSNGTERR